MAREVFWVQISNFNFADTESYSLEKVAENTFRASKTYTVIIKI